MSKKSLWLELLLDTKKAKKQVKDIKKDADKEISKSGTDKTSSKGGKVQAGTGSGVANQVASGMMKAQILNQGIQYGVKAYGAITDYARGAGFEYEKNDAMRNIGFSAAGSAVGMVNPALGSAISQMGAFLDTAEYKNFKDVTQKTHSQMMSIDAKAQQIGVILSEGDLKQLAPHVAKHEKWKQDREKMVRRVSEKSVKDIGMGGESGMQRLTGAIEKLSYQFEKATGSAPIFGYWKNVLGG